MKKFVAILLTLMLVLGIGAAVADEAPATPTTDKEIVTIYKSYRNVNDNGISPEETFTLEQVGNGQVVDGEDKGNVAPHLGTITGATYADYGATTAGAKLGITVELPSYDKVGVYEYTLQEVAGTTAGVAYYGQKIKLVVTVVNGKNNDLLCIAGVHTESSGNKSDTFENTYSAGTLKVSMTVDGKLGDKNKYFEFKVTLTGEAGKTYGDSYRVTGGSYTTNPEVVTIVAGEEKEYTFMLKHDETISIANLPYGVKYTVTETVADGYTTSATGDTGKINAAEQTAAFTNTKTGSIDTGVTTENLPYVLLIGFVALAGAALLIKRKAHNN